MVRATLDPVVGLRAFVDSFQYLRASGNRLGIRVLLRNLLPTFGAVVRHDLVARFDGAALPFSIRWNRVGDVLREAVQRLGEGEYERLREQGRSMTDDQLVDMVSPEVDAIAMSLPVLQPAE